jgi:hypothetical protein
LLRFFLKGSILLAMSPAVITGFSVSLGILMFVLALARAAKRADDASEQALEPESLSMLAPSEASKQEPTNGIVAPIS